MNSFFALAALAATAAADIDFEDILSGEVAVEELIDWDELSHEMERERK